jgi:Ca2+-binding RTX toxin-like protein
VNVKILTNLLTGTATNTLIACDPFILTIEGEGDTGAGGGGDTGAGTGGGGDGAADGAGDDGGDTGDQSALGGAGDDSSTGGEGDDTAAGGEGDDTAAGGEGDDTVDATGAPDTYELKPPEGMELDTDAIAVAEPIFRELNLSNEQANKLVGVYAELGKKATEKVATMIAETDAQVRKDWLNEAKDADDIGKAKWNETLNLSARALDALGYPKGSPFRKLLDDSGLGNHPEMIRAFRKIGEAVTEDGVFPRSNSGDPVESNYARIMYPDQKPKE